MSFGYFAGPQAITSSTTRYVPSSPAQLSTVVVHQQEGPCQLCRSWIILQRFHSTVLFAFGTMNIYGIYIRWEKIRYHQVQFQKPSAFGLSNNCDKMVCYVLSLVGNGDQQ